MGRTKLRWGARAAVLALALTATDGAYAQSGVGFPITTMPSLTAPSPTPAPYQPSSTDLPAQAALPQTAATPEAGTEGRANAAASAEPAPHFGQRGQIAISGQLSASLGFLSYDQSSASSNTVSIEPAFHYFFADQLLVGGSVFMRYEDGTSALGFKASKFTFGASARFGVNVSVGKALSFEPVAGLGFWQAQTSFDQSAPGYTAVGGTSVEVGPDVAETAVFVSLYAPLLVHPASHFFLGLGPDAYRDLTHTVEAGGTSANPRRTFVGISSVVGGWF